MHFIFSDINERDDREDVGRRRRNDDEPMPELYSIFKGEVKYTTWSAIVHEFLQNENLERL